MKTSLRAFSIKKAWQSVYRLLNNNILNINQRDCHLVPPRMTLGFKLFRKCQKKSSRHLLIRQLQKQENALLFKGRRNLVYKKKKFERAI